VRNVTDVRKSALVAFPIETIFDLVEAAEHYPAFLPWCAGATVLARDDNLVSARIGVDYHGVRFSFVTRNPKRRPEYMAIQVQEGPFRRFEGEWQLTPLAADACKIDFRLHYEFQSAVMAKVAGPVFDRIANTLVNAFVGRAEELYGSEGQKPV
jgi:ribosome-associated toxin RatA of RatAB toxin-antitoxin module